jgi:hypothetical protein
MSIENLALKGSVWKSQPFKGLLFVVAIALISLVFELLLDRIFRLDVQSKLVYIILCFVWWWHLGFSLNGYPGNRFFSHRFGRGTLNLIVLFVLVYITGEVWKYIFDKTSLTDISVGLGGQTAIVVAASSLFFFDNTLIATESIRDWHPVSGLLNIFFALFFIAPVLTFLPLMWGLEPFYIPWYWYPCSTVVGSFFERWPFSKLELGMPLGLLHTGAVVLLTLTMALFLKRAGMDLFTTATGPTFAAIWTTVGLAILWQFNMWPFSRLSQPTKGIVTTISSLLITLLLYLVTELLLGRNNMLQGVYWWFNILLVQVFLMAPGLYDGLNLWQDRQVSILEQKR